MKPMRNNELERQLDATRIKINELTKNMTTQERVAFFNIRGQEILKRHGLKTTVSNPPSTRRGDGSVVMRR